MNEHIGGAPLGAELDLLSTMPLAGRGGPCSRGLMAHRLSSAPHQDGLPLSVIRYAAVRRFLCVWSRSADHVSLLGALDIKPFFTDHTIDSFSRSGSCAMWVFSLRDLEA